MEDTLHGKIVQNAKQNPAVILGNFTDIKAKEFATKYNIEYTIGSHRKQRYLISIKDEYYVLPIVWDVVNKNWEEKLVDYWDRRTYNNVCIGCHVTNYNPDDKSYTELDIGCEACHGPGYEHILSGGDAEHIVNPSKLSGTLKKMVCAACHSKVGTDKSKKYPFPVGFVPGRNLIDFIDLGIDSTTKEAEEIVLDAFKEWEANRCNPCQKCEK